jgi:hypothetical protein|tara:strand:+ start:11610 stop:12305 length:696 start_codon:yes stop_codon:yes gene_type:complete
MIFNVPFDVRNIDNQIQISISQNTKAKQRIKREGVNEYTKDAEGNFLLTHHPDHNFLVKSNTNYFLLEGSLKIRYEWDETSVFQNEHLDIFKELLNQHNAGLTNLPEIPTSGDGFLEATTVQEYRSDAWRAGLLYYEPYCTSAEITIMEDNTVLLCPMQHYPGWTFEQIDILPGESVVSAKPGDNTYIVFGDTCSIAGTAIAKHATKKQTSSEITIKNDSLKVCKLVRIYK